MEARRMPGLGGSCSLRCRRREYPRLDPRSAGPHFHPCSLHGPHSDCAYFLRLGGATPAAVPAARKSITGVLMEHAIDSDIVDEYMKEHLTTQCIRAGQIAYQRSRKLLRLCTTRLSKFRCMSKSIFYLHLNECEFRCNH